jgi:hypothetical protein
MERVLAVHPNRADRFRCLLRCAHGSEGMASPDPCSSKIKLKVGAPKYINIDSFPT